MKHTLTLISALALLALPAQAAKLEQWLKLLPKNTVGYFAIKDAPELMTDWEKSGYGKMIADPEFKKWIAPVYKDGEPAWDKEFKEGTGEGLEANLKRIQGSVLLVIAGDSPEDMEDTAGKPFAILMEVGDQQAKWEELLAKDVDEDLTEDKELRKLTKDVAGVPLNVLAVSEEADAKWKQAYAFVDGTLIIGDKPALLEYLISAVKSGNGEVSETVTSHINRHAQLSDGTADITAYVNGETLMKWLEQTLTKTMKSGQSAMPIDPKTIFEALGTKEFQSIGFAVDLNDKESRIDFGLLHPANPTGLLTLFRGTSTDVPLPAFIPADVLSGQVGRQSLEEIYSGLLGIVNKLGPVAMMATMQISQIEQQMGFKIKEDLFGSLGDEIITTSDGEALEQSQVFGIKVKDHAKLVGVLESLKKFVGQGFGAAFEDTEYLGHTISTYKASQAATPGAASTEIGYCLTKDYLLFSTGKQEVLKKVLSRMKEPAGPSIWDSPRTQDLIASLPKNYFGLGVADASKQLLLVVDAMTAVQKQAAGKKKSGGAAKKKGPGKGPKADAAGETEAASDDLTEWFDPAARPSDEMFKKYLGTEASANYNLPEAFHVRMLSKPVQ
ncbi:hypothetical protein [Brevifollis gellanilyticus]|uniref:DUF3352 domain-containing protein n=1 Tax=Brevifollis gellanilyticus TaxID=748831 RepID=A0A512M905_9BACT|nr:hypothetical protein [Brevifollis gellanilyticus]GEP43227.1 hypothetical protein BGE01nite_25180 [Brevifollis gellanilyticus]